MGPHEQVKSQAISSTYKLLIGMTGGFGFPMQINPFSSTKDLIISFEWPVVL